MRESTRTAAGRRLTDAVQTSDTGLLVLALVVGAGAGGGAIVFRFLIESFTYVLSGHKDYSAAGHAANHFVPALGRWFVVLAPVVAGLLYGPLVHFFAREARGHGVPEVMFAVARRGGRIQPQVAAVKALASALCIGGGGSVGREGPIVQIGSALGSTLGRALRVPESRMRVLVACGAAGGIAATFNAPLAGVFFAMELILRDFATRSFGMVVISSVTASVIGRAAFGNTSFLHLPTFTVTHPIEYLLFALLGLLAGVVGVVFTRVLYWIEDACDFVWRGPEWLRPAIGGVLLGLLLLVLPEMYGVGYPVLGRGAAGDYTIAFLAALLVGKMVATSLTIGIGGSGGVFAPSLFIGAMFGAIFGGAAHAVLPGQAGAVGTYALIGMGAVFAGSARAPITAVIILFELTGEYSIILPLMAAIVLATGVSQLMSRDTIYTLKLRRRGVDLDAPPPLPHLTSLTAGELVDAVDTSVAADASLAEIAALLTAEPTGQLAVTDADGSYRGVITAQDVADALADGESDDTRVDTLTVRAAYVREHEPLETALDALDSLVTPALPVLATDRDVVIGWLTHRRALDGLRRGAAAAADAAAPSPPAAAVDAPG